MAGPYTTSSDKNYVGFGKQSAKGSATAPTLFLPYKGGVSLDHGLEGEDVHEGGTGPYVSRTHKQKHDPSGGASCAWRPKTGATAAAWFLGNDVSSAAGALFSHAATPAEALVYLSAEQNLADEAVERFIDSFLKSFTIEGQGGDDLMLGLEWFGFTPAWQASPATETYETGISGSTPGGPYRQNEATYTVDGAGNTTVERYKIELAWKYDEDLRLSQITRAYTVKFELTGKITLRQLALAPDDYRKVPYGSTAGTAPSKNFFQTGAFVAAYDNGLATTNLRTLNINLPNVDWKKAKYTDLNPDGETVFIEREGTIKKIAGTPFCTITSVTADTAAY